jgi:cytidylate kinase
VIRVITIDREYGCGAGPIAQKIATRLGWKIWDQLLTQEIARLAHWEKSVVEKREEHRDSLYYRLLKSFALGSYEGSSPPIEMLDADSIVRISERVVHQAATEGNCVIVGRGSQHFLRSRDDTLRFFLYASRGEKVRRLVSEGKNKTDAEELANRIDEERSAFIREYFHEERSAFIREYFHAEWPERSIYHAMINTGSGDETVIQAIMTFLQQTRSQRPCSHQAA